MLPNLTARLLIRLTSTEPIDNSVLVTWLDDVALTRLSRKILQGLSFKLIVSILLPIVLNLAVRRRLAQGRLVFTSLSVQVRTNILPECCVLFVRDGSPLTIIIIIDLLL